MAKENLINQLKSTKKYLIRPDMVRLYWVTILSYVNKTCTWNLKVKKCATISNVFVVILVLGYRQLSSLFTHTHTNTSFGLCHSLRNFTRVRSLSCTLYLLYKSRTSFEWLNRWQNCNGNTKKEKYRKEEKNLICVRMLDDGELEACAQRRMQ